MVNSIFYSRSVPHQSLVENSPTAENSMIVFSTNKGKSQQKSKTQVSAVAFSATLTSSIDYDGGAFEVRKRMIPVARRKQLTCPIAMDCNSLFNDDK